MTTGGSLQDIYVSMAILIIALASSLTKKLTPRGAATGALLAWIIWLGTGLHALGAMFTFFVLGTFATAWEKGKKQQIKADRAMEGHRDVANVVANGGVAAGLATIALMFPQHQSILQQAVIAAFAAACSDTFSSELGNAYGKRYFRILILRPSPPGPDGVVSIAGLAFGIAGSAIIAVFSWLAIHDFRAFFIITLSGFAGNIADSVLGDTLQRKDLLNNHHVNFLATATGALIAFLLLKIIEIP